MDSWRYSVQLVRAIFGFVDCCWDGYVFGFWGLFQKLVLLAKPRIVVIVWIYFAIVMLSSGRLMSLKNV
jgi:hypothetical protein